MLKRLRETYQWNLDKLARKQEMLKRVKKRYQWNLHKLARKQEMLKRLQGDVPVVWSGKGISFVVRQRQLCGSRGTPACAGQPGLLKRWVKRTTLGISHNHTNSSALVSPLSQLQVHNKLPQARQLLGHNLERCSL